MTMKQAKLLQTYVKKMMNLSLCMVAKGDMETLYRVSTEMVVPQVGDDAHYLCLYYKAMALKQLGDEAASREALMQASIQFDGMEEGRMSTQLRGLRATIRMELGRYEDALADLKEMEEIAKEAKDSPENIQRALRELEKLKRLVRQRMSSFI